MNAGPDCYLCEEPCDEEDFCNGCQEYICGNCDQEQPLGRHEPEEHKDDNEEAI